uniref:C2H2-type domain-containing protein n=1 Tax=Cyprinus carpio TaxID=7962 RepID=A0A8C2FNY5_CYPCA
MNLPATLVTQLPLSGQIRPSAPALYTIQNSIKMIKIAQTVNKISPAPDPPHLTLQQLLQTTPLVPAKTTDLVPQFVAVPQTLIRPHFPQSSCVARPKVPILIPSVVRPLMPNLARMTLRIPTPSNPPFPSQVVVSFSPTVNVSAPCLVSANRPVLRQTPLANIRPLPVNVPLMTSVTCPTLVSTIFPCRHCGAVSRQPSLKVRHRYLHRGSRLYRCQCGRSFQRQLHLLRHQVQHAESVRFVCAQCGNTFEGAHKLTWHKRKHRNGKQCVKKKCKAAFDCSCGQMFTRPSALLWHMLKNSKLSKPTQKNSQSVSV